MSALSTCYNSQQTTQPAQASSSTLSAPPSGTDHPQGHNNGPQESHTAHPSVPKATAVHPASPHKSASPETDPDSTTAVHTKSASPASTSDRSHPQGSSAFMTPPSASSMSTKPASPGRTSAAKARSEPDIKTKGYALGQDKIPSAPLAICGEENNAEAKGGNGRGLYGRVDVQKVGGRSKMLSKRTPTVTKLEDGRELDLMGEGGDDKQRDHTEQEIKPEIQDAQVGSAAQDKKRKTRESDDDNGKANVKVTKTGAMIEPIKDSPPSEIDELRNDDLGEEGEGSETDEFDPLDEVRPATIRAVADLRSTCSITERDWRTTGTWFRMRWNGSFSVSDHDTGGIWAKHERGRTASSSRGMDVLADDLPLTTAFDRLTTWCRCTTSCLRPFRKS